MDVYEVFRQEKEGGPMVHSGNLLAPDAELAAHYAREFYGRRQESVRLWVVRREAITDVSDPDMLKPPFDRSFKKPVGYSGEIKRKLAAARERVAGASAGDDDPVAAGQQGAEP
jgi:ring-1,2-phenylacetyl-CoA epoxidase subunit PaaB